METFKKTDLTNIVVMCQDYIDQTDKQEQVDYQAELNEVACDFDELTNSGIFHDAIGKVVSKTTDVVVVTTEY